MKKLNLLLSCVLLILALSCCEEESDSVVSPKTGKALVDTTINVSLSDVTVSIEEGVTVTIPQGLSTSSFDIVIREIDELPAAPATMKLHKVYDIELSIGDEFEKEITIRFDLDASVFEDKAESDFAFGFFNNDQKKWAIFPDYTINTDEYYAECRTDHLTTVGFIEFITTGGYAYKFVGGGVTVYYGTGDDEPMSWSEYQPDDQDWHLPSGDKNWAPVYIQDIAHYTSEAREILSESPWDLDVSEGNINIYVKNLDQSDGEYGSISGAIYLKNKMKLPAHVSGIKYQYVLKATCAHELMHLIQDNYYVMNKGSIGLWWLEATATQSDRMVWGSSLLYSESELYSIEANSTLLETLSKSWDDCNKDPNWYLSGCFLHYMSHYREGSKLNIAEAVKAGGANTGSLMRVILNDLIDTEFGTSLWEEYHDYVVYLFTQGNEKLSAFPFDKDYNQIETASALTKQVKMSKKDNTQSLSVSLPYLSTKLISVSNLENTDMRINYNLSEIDAGIEAYLCEVDAAAGKFKIIDDLYKGKSGDVDLDARIGGNYDNFVILMINTGFTEGKKEAKFTFKTSTEFKEFSLISFKLEGDDGNINFSNGNTDNAWEIGFVDFYGQPEYEVISKSFSGNKVKLTIREKRDSKVQYKDYTSTVTVEGEYSSSEFIYLKLNEEIIKFKEEWSDEKEKWVDHKITESKELEYHTIPFSITENQYGIVYSFIENDNSKIKNNLKKLSHTIKEVDDEDNLVEEYYLLPINWSSLPGYFNLSMVTTK